MARAMHDFQEQCQTMFRAKLCLSLFSLKQCIIKTIIRFSFVMSGIIKVEVSRYLPRQMAETDDAYLDLDYSGYHTQKKPPMQ